MSKTRPHKLNCWKCGLELRELLTPIPRYETCPQCRVELRVCRMCRHFDPKVIGQCRHDRADRVEKKHEVNYCTYFRPRRNAHLVLDEPSPSDDSKHQLNELFGTTEAQPPAPESLESLFGLEPPEDDK